MKRNIISILLAVMAVLMSGCNFLEPLPNGAYTDENIDQYPQILRGFVDKAYVNADINPHSYSSARYLYLTAATDEAIYSNETATIAQWANGDRRLNSLFADEWSNCYIGINYVNRFLRNREGYNTRYMVNQQADLALRNELQGSAFGLRAWFHFTLLRIFGGKAENGLLLGIPLRTEYTDINGIDANSVSRNTYEECIEQILADCDSAMVYLHENNRDYPDDPAQIITVTGSARYGTLDRIAIQSLKAMTYLLWASPAFNPDGDLTRYEKAAECAAAVITHKIEREGGVLGKFSPTGSFRWTDPNSPEIIWCSRFVQSSNLETTFYPMEFGGNASVVPTRNMVDRFPMANGYPITDSRSGYIADEPFSGRDPRLYANIYYNGSYVIRNGTDVRYTFECATGGKDAPGGRATSPTSFYIKKFLYNAWDPYDTSVETGFHFVMRMRFTEIALIFAEAASRVTGPVDATMFGYSAKQVLGWLRARPTEDGLPGVGAVIDPYLDECAEDAGKFYDLVKNEWRIETCFEGISYYNVRRWSNSVDKINIPIYGTVVTDNGDGSCSYSDVLLRTNDYPSLWTPLPYSELRRAPSIVQNEGWGNWK